MGHPDPEVISLPRARIQQSSVRRDIVITALFAIIAIVATAVAPAAASPARAATTQSISGTVSLPSSIPAEALQAITVVASPTFTGWADSSSVDEHGSYAIAGLEPGEYRVEFQVGTYWDGTQDVTPSLVGEYYDDASGWDDATLVDIATGDATGIDAALEVGYSITGHIALPAGAPAEWMQGVTVSASSDSGAYGYGYPDSTGAYEIAGLPADAYRVEFQVNSYWDDIDGDVTPNLVAEYYDDTVDWGSASLIELDADVADIDATLESGRTISGRVTLPDDAPAEWMQTISVSASSVYGSGHGYASVDADGAYAITGLPIGAYRVEFRAGGTYIDEDGNSQMPNLVSEYWDDALDWNAATDIDLNAGDATGIDATLEEGRTISGTVTLPDGAPAEWMQAISVSASSTAGYMYYTASVDSDGGYTISGLPDGDYLVEFRGDTYWDPSLGEVSTNLVTQYFDSAGSREDASPVDVSAGDQTGVDAAMVLGRSISGTVAIPADAPAEWMQDVSVSAFTPSGETIAYGEVDSETGTFEIQRLGSREYVLRFEAWGAANLATEYFDDAASLDEATPITVGDSDVTGVTVELGYGAAIDATVDLSAVNAHGAEGVSFLLLGLDGGSRGGFGGDGIRDEIETSWRNLTPGSYRLAALTTTWDADGGIDIVTSQYLRFEDDAFIELAAGEEYTGTLVARAVDSVMEGSISTEGFPASAEGKVLGSAIVYEKLEGEWIPVPELFANAGSTAPTEFSFRLPEGTYTVGFENDRTDPEVGGVSEEWWNGQDRLSNADEIAIASGVTRGGIDGTLRPAGYVPPVYPPSSPHGVVADPGDGKALVSWEAPTTDGGATISGYTVNAFPGGKTWTTSGALEVLVDGLVNGTAYTFTVTATNAQGTSPASDPADPVTPATTPIAPTAVEAVASADSATVSWQPPIDDGGAVITGYTVTASPGGQTAATTGATTAEVNGLTPGTAYTFTVTASNRVGGSPASAPSPSVTPGATDTTPGVSFVDVGASSTFYDEIRWLASEGISRGWPDGTFRPLNSVTREQMAAFLYRLAGEPDFTAPAVSPFLDVKPGHTFYKEIAWLGTTGISNGWIVSGGAEYRPLEKITREQMAAFLYRFSSSPDYVPAGGTPFRDVGAGSTFYKEIRWLASEGVTTGWVVGGGCREFRPLSKITREQMAAFMYRMENGGTDPVTSGACGS
ncbi:carboxypeptidase regulatory-like domain-containing protein [Microbacterium thalassium]|uniref:alpha-amylase n=1 Tax=Microbacterium thalassium TaxID=362649 RepID=A0A7X0FPH1_9MICO|nr:carboxypeptidase regulatory-like domain-containing protein [Microbacterium thalassium]MBB6391299.1 hypothetical protein [Microbacterium thalassium]GLK23589.1 hypothetical protein GCM10017607_09070 [Microbacterium thalassium]